LDAASVRVAVSDTPLDAEYALCGASDVAIDSCSDLVMDIVTASVTAIDSDAGRTAVGEIPSKMPTESDRARSVTLAVMLSATASESARECDVALTIESVAVIVSATLGTMFVDMPSEAPMVSEMARLVTLPESSSDPPSVSVIERVTDIEIESVVVMPSAADRDAK
jgi:hypothetical protein